MLLIYPNIESRQCKTVYSGVANFRLQEVNRMCSWYAGYKFTVLLMRFIKQQCFTARLNIGSITHFYHASTNTLASYPGHTKTFFSWSGYEPSECMRSTEKPCSCMQFVNKPFFSTSHTIKIHIRCFAIHIRGNRETLPVTGPPAGTLPTNTIHESINIYRK